MLKIKKIISFLINIIPTTNYIAFCSYPDFTDNAFAVYKYMLENGFAKKYRLIWLITEKDNYDALKMQIKHMNPDTKVAQKISLKGFYYYVRSRYVFYTHGFWDSIPTKQHINKMINLWHGMPFKKIGFLEQKTSDGWMQNTQITIATNDFFKKLMAKAFKIPEKDVFVIGQPKNDLFFEKTNFFEQNKIDIFKYEKIGIWLPTFRMPRLANVFVNGKDEVRLDGNYEKGKISIFKEDELDELDEFLTRNNQFLLIKLHPMDVLQDYVFQQFKNILIIKQKDFRSQLYPLVGACDYLITDYSSVWIDFDVCNKPIGFAMDDIDKYKNSRGLTVENIIDFLPTDSIIENLDQLKEFILNSEKHKKETNEKYNKYKDNNSTKRLSQMLKIKNQ